MTHGSFFSGIGGFDLAAEMMGWDNKFHCEIEEFPRKVLDYYWPNAQSYEDIKSADFSVWRNKIDILTGGFPCQPYSQAGKREGKNDERHLWPFMLEGIRTIQPKWIVGENVFGITNWNEGLVFEEVQADLEAEGYEVQSFILPAAGTGAPHKRDRVWFVAYSRSNGHESGGSGKDRRKTEASEGEGDQRERVRDDSRGDGEQGYATYTKSFGHRGSEDQGSESLGGGELLQGESEGGTMGSETEGRSGKRVATYPKSRRSGGLRDESEEEGTHGSDELLGEQHRLSSQERDDTDSDSERCEGYEFNGTFNEFGKWTREPCKPITELYEGAWDGWPTQSPVCGGNDGIPGELDAVTVPRWRRESLKAYGNAVVPQVVLQIFKAIDEYERLAG